MADLLTKTRTAIGGAAIARPAQLVRHDLAGNVLRDGTGVPAVIDVAPTWRPVRWADAVCLLDGVPWDDAPPAT